MKVLAGDGHHGDGPGGRGAAYLIGGQRFEAGTPRFAEAVAEAHAARQRPRCLCLAEGVEMYIARLAGAHEGYVVKRMPGTGSQHAPDCPAYEPPPEATGLGQVLGSAISEDPATGETTLKLDFPLSKIAGRSAAPAVRRPTSRSRRARSSRHASSSIASMPTAPASRWSASPPTWSATAG